MSDYDEMARRACGCGGCVPVIECGPCGMLLTYCRKEAIASAIREVEQNVRDDYRENWAKLEQFKSTIDEQNAIRIQAHGRIQQLQETESRLLSTIEKLKVLALRVDETEGEREAIRSEMIREAFGQAEQLAEKDATIQEQAEEITLLQAGEHARHRAIEHILRVRISRHKGRLNAQTKELKEWQSGKRRTVLSHPDHDQEEDHDKEEGE